FCNSVWPRTTRDSERHGPHYSSVLWYVIHRPTTVKCRPPSSAHGDGRRLDTKGTCCGGHRGRVCDCHSWRCNLAFWSACNHLMGWDIAARAGFMVGAAGNNDACRRMVQHMDLPRPRDARLVPRREIVDYRDDDCECVLFGIGQTSCAVFEPLRSNRDNARVLWNAATTFSLSRSDSSCSGQETPALCWPSS